MRLILAGAAALAILALFDVARPETTQSVPGSGSVRLTDVALPAPAGGPFGGFAADNDDDQASSRRSSGQLAQQQMQQSQQQAEEQNEQAEQQFEQGMQQAQMDEQQANDP